MEFFHWKRNFYSFNQSTWLFYLIFALALLFCLIIWIFRKSISVYFNSNEQKKYFFNLWNKKTLFTIIGLITILFNVLRLTILITKDYPWKWELIPLHLCRFYIILIGFLLIFNKTHLVKYFVISCFIGAIAAFIFADLGEVKSYIQDDIVYNNLIQNTESYKRAGLNVGLDSYLFWDFALGHAYAIIMPIFLSVISGKKVKLKLREFLLGCLFLFIYSIFIFFLNWIFFAISKNLNNPRILISLNSNWLYLGQTGVNALGVLTQWPYSVFSLPIIFFILSYILYLLYTILEAIKFDFTNKKIYFVYNRKLLKIKNKKEAHG
ncbi:TMEM164 family acyltransferase [[Mycoplasma] collis]|uniref:TMEM164 family acyltransferase n=1 Tax=[Mycoplasma] collis TaxID=2127 RepID=UPI00051BB4D3|nr:YwaF family protein [[Mycoplasma] collis]